MHLIVCIDQRDGLSFCGRQLSRDAAVNAHILEQTTGSCLWMTEDSAKRFPDADHIVIHENCQNMAGEGDYCLAELDIEPGVADRLESVFLYNWNRSYPSTVKFPRELLNMMSLEYTEDFPGNSHETITLERYKR